MFDVCVFLGVGGDECAAAAAAAWQPGEEGRGIERWAVVSVTQVAELRQWAQGLTIDMCLRERRSRPGRRGF